MEINMDSKLELKLTVAEINTVLAGLGNQPYVQVAELIANIQRQVTPQLNQPTDAA
jgi:hypothetical protein